MIYDIVGPPPPGLRRDERSAGSLPGIAPGIVLSEVRAAGRFLFRKDPDRSAEYRNLIVG